MAETSIAITDADLTNPAHAAAVVDLIDVLATWPENGNSLSENVRSTLISKLKSRYTNTNHSSGVSLAYVVCSRSVAMAHETPPCGE